MRCRLGIVVLALSLSAHAGGAQELTFLTGIVKNVRSLSLSLDAAKLGSASELTGAGTKCLVLDLCGASAEVYINVGSQESSVMHYELAVGAGYTRALRLKDPSLDLRGAIRTFPRFGVYATAPFKVIADSMHFYFGGTFGLSDLFGAHVIDSVGKSTPVTAQSFDYGFAAGLAHDVGIFVEASWTARRFASVDYGREEVSGWPRQIKAGGLKVSVGWQFHVDQDGGPPDFAGRWTLTKVEGQPLPGIVTQRTIRDETRADLPITGSVRDEIVTAYLVISADSRNPTYTLEVQTRRTTYDALGNVIAIEYQRVEPLTGRYEVQRRRLRLQNADGSWINVLRMDQEIAFRLPDSGRLVSFRTLGY